MRTMVQRLRDKLLITAKSARNPGKQTSLPTRVLYLIGMASFIVTERVGSVFLFIPVFFKELAGIKASLGE